MALSNSDLRFKIGFYKSTKKFSLTDMFTSTVWNTALLELNASKVYTDVDGLVKASNPAGTYFYGASNYDNNIFTVPDINGSTGFTKSNMSLPTTLTNGLYTFYYKARVHLGTGTVKFVSVASGKFRVNTMTGEPFAGNIPTALYVQVVSSTPANNGTWLIDTITDFNGYTEIYSSAVSTLTYTPAATDEIYIIFETSKAYNYSFAELVPSIEVSSDCAASTITGVDNTVYDITSLITNTKFTPTSTSKTWTYVYPNLVKTTGTSTAEVLVVPPNIWTGVYSISRQIIAFYEIEVWAGSNYSLQDFYWFNIYDTITLSTSHTVRCSTCLCDLMQCIINLDTRLLQAAADKDTREYARLLSLQKTVDHNYVMILASERCGEPTNQWCEGLLAAVKSIDCTCDTDTTISFEVIPVYNQIIGAALPIPTTFGTATTGIPATPVDYQIHVFTTDGTTNFDTTGTGDAPVDVYEGDYYQYNGSYWIKQYNNMGVAATVKNPLLYNNTTGVSSVATGVQTLMSDAIGAGIIATGEIVDIYSLFLISAGFVGEVYLEVNGYKLLSETVDASAATVQLELKIKMTNTGALTGNYRYETTYLGTPESTVSSASTVMTMAWANSQTVIAKRDSSVNQANCVQSQLTIKRTIF